MLGNRGRRHCAQLCRGVGDPISSREKAATQTTRGSSTENRPNKQHQPRKKASKLQQKRTKRNKATARVAQTEQCKDTPNIQFGSSHFLFETLLTCAECVRFYCVCCAACKSRQTMGKNRKWILEDNNSMLDHFKVSTPAKHTIAQFSRSRRWRKLESIRPVQDRVAQTGAFLVRSRKKSESMVAEAEKIRVDIKELEGSKTENVDWMQSEARAQLSPFTVTSDPQEEIRRLRMEASQGGDCIQEVWCGVFVMCRGVLWCVVWRVVVLWHHQNTLFTHLFSQAQFAIFHRDRKFTLSLFFSYKQKQTNRFCTNIFFFGKSLQVNGWVVMCEWVDGRVQTQCYVVDFSRCGWQFAVSICSSNDDEFNLTNTVLKSYLHSERHGNT